MSENIRHGKANDEKTVEPGFSKKNFMDVVYTVKPLCDVQKWFGVLLFSINDGDIALPTWKMKTLAVLSIVSYCVVYLYVFEFPKIVNKKLVYFIKEVPDLVVLVQYVTGTITSVFFVNATKMNIIKAYAKLDTLLRVEIIDDFYKISRTETVRYLVIVIVSHVILCAACYSISQEHMMSHLADLPLYLFQKFQILTFSKLILMLRRRLMLINEYVTTFIETHEKKTETIFTLRDNKARNESKLNFIGRPFERNMKIRDLATMYDMMGEICSTINKVWSFQIFMTLASTFVFIIITMWIALYFYQTPEESFLSMINVIIWCFNAIVMVAVMSYTCERLLQVRKETKALITKVVTNYDLPKTMRVQAKAFIELIDAWPLRIYIYDMFSVDITLILKFISVATTYLIVIIQMSHLF